MKESSKMSEWLKGCAWRSTHSCLESIIRSERPDCRAGPRSLAVAELLQAIEQELPHVLRRIDGEE